MGQKRWTYLIHTVIALVFYFAFLLIAKYPEWRHKKKCEQKCLDFWAKNVLDTEDFSSFDNERGRRDGRYVVPNYVHFLRLDQGEITFTEAVCLLAAWKHQKPQKLFLHADKWPQGKYWDLLMSDDEFSQTLLPILGTSIPNGYNGVPINSKVKKNHGLMLTKLKILMKYGGIFIDNNSFVVKSLNDFRRYEMTLDGNESGNRTTKVIVANKNSRLLGLWAKYYIESYSNDKGTTSDDRDIVNGIYKTHPRLFHWEKFFLVDSEEMLKRVYHEKWKEWINHYVIHLADERLTTMRDPNKIFLSFNEKDIKRWATTIKQMVLKVFPVHD